MLMKKFYLSVVFNETRNISTVSSQRDIKRFIEISYTVISPSD